jgi:hypothetical protein
MSNDMVNNIRAVNDQITRLQAAAASAASGYGGTAGTEFETGSTFGVAPSASPGAQGAAWQFAVGTINTAWATFMTASLGAINTLDNG